MCLARLQCPPISAASVSSPATVACRNEPGGKVTRAAPIMIVGALRISTSSPWRVSRARRCCSATRDSVAIMLCRQRSGAAHVDIEAVVGGGDLDVERLCGWYQRLGDRPRRVERAAQAGIEDRTMIDGNDVVRTCSGEAHLEHVVRARPGVQRNPPPAEAVGVDQRIALRRRASPAPASRRRDCASTHDSVRLPSAGSRSPRRRQNAGKTARPVPGLRARPHQAPAVGMMTRYRRDFDRLAAKRVRHIDVLSVDQRRRRRQSDRRDR